MRMLQRTWLKMSLVLLLPAMAIAQAQVPGVNERSLPATSGGGGYSWWWIVIVAAIVIALIWWSGSQTRPRQQPPATGGP